MLSRGKARTFRDKNILVIGLARSGTGAANLLAFLGTNVWIADTKPADSLRDGIGRLNPAVKVTAGGYPDEFLGRADAVVISPGVPLDIPPLVRARKKGIPVIGELELAYQIVKEWGYGSRVMGQKKQTLPPLPRTAKRGGLAPCPSFIAVTGTNGKSTTTTLIGLMLKKAGFNTLIGGNIGNALTEEIYKAVMSYELRVKSGEFRETPNSELRTPNFIVAEVSSFQLESINHFRPRVAVVLNITPDHLDRYRTMKEYVDAKARIFENQGHDDYLILNADDPLVMKVESEKLKVESEKPKILYFSRQKEVEGAYFKGGVMKFNVAELNLQPETFRIKGVHNLENVMAASLAALICGCPAEVIRGVLRDFRGLEHRLEFVSEVDGVTFINDSKGTNVGAVVKSLESFERVILIMGGRDKAGDFSVLRNLIKTRVKTLILIGEAKEKIAVALGGLTDTVFVTDMKEAVETSMSKASGGDVVLLSPGCASFDMFADFEDRGRRFKEAVNEVKNLKLKVKS